MLRAVGPSNTLSNVTIASVSPSGTYTPVDASGAGLVFTVNSGYYQKVGNIITAVGSVTFPTTGNTATAAISLPLPVPAKSYAQTPSPLFVNTAVATAYWAYTVAGQSYFFILAQSLSNYLQNVQLTALRVDFTVTYTAS